MGAEDWTNFRPSLAEEHPAVMLLAMRLGIDSYDAMLGKLFRLHTMLHRNDGVTIIPEVADQILRCKGLCQAVVSLGWCAIESGSLVMVAKTKDSDRDAAKLEKKRERQRKYRQRRNQLCGPDIAKSDERRATRRATQGENDAPKVKEVEVFPIPEDLNTPAFAEAWATWEKYRRELKKTLTPSTREHQFKQLAKLTVEQAIACLELSITNGWTGLFPNQILGADNGGRTRQKGQTRGTGRLHTQPGEYESLATHGLPAAIDAQDDAGPERGRRDERTLFDQQEAADFPD